MKKAKLTQKQIDDFKRASDAVIKENLRKNEDKLFATNYFGLISRY